MSLFSKIKRLFTNNTENTEGETLILLEEDNNQTDESTTLFSAGSDPEANTAVMRTLSLNNPTVDDLQLALELTKARRNLIINGVATPLLIGGLNLCMFFIPGLRLQLENLLSTHPYLLRLLVAGIPTSAIQSIHEYITPIKLSFLPLILDWLASAGVGPTIGFAIDQTNLSEDLNMVVSNMLVAMLTMIIFQGLKYGYINHLQPRLEQQESCCLLRPA